MMKCKMKQVTLAVGAVLGTLSLLPSAQAVNLATDGLGQALIFPYYTTRPGWNTLINITNTSNEVVVIKVVFHEGYNSRDVFDFNVIMSPFDVWNGTVSNGPGDIPVFSTQDTTCTVPQIPAGGQPFQGSGANGTLAYTNRPGGVQAADGGPTGTDRMREGYITVVMMGTALATPGTLAANSVHTAARVPLNCAALRNAFALSGTTIAGLRAAFPNYAVNPLKGAFSLVNAASGWNAGGEAVTLANFFVPPAGATATYQGLNLITAQLPPDRVANVFTDSFHEPDLNAGNTSGQVLLANGAPVSDSANLVPPVTTGVAAVSFVLNRASVVNQWANLDAAPPARPWDVKSDWVVSFPTKRFHVDTARHEFAGQATGRPGVPTGLAPPFSQVFSAGRSCDDVNYTIYDREEQQIIRQDEPVFSPAPSTPGNQLCQEVNVLTFGADSNQVTNVLKSPMGPGTLSGSVPNLPGNNGWMQLNFRNATRALPVVGFSVINRNEPTGLLNESFIVDNAYIR